MTAPPPPPPALTPPSVPTPVPTRRRSLSSRLIWSFIIVALVAVTLSSLLSLNFVRGQVEDDARAEVAEQALALARATDQSDADAAIRLVQASGNEVAVVDPRGRVTGDASPWVTASIVDALLDGERVSTSTPRIRGRVMLHGEPTVGGGGVVVVRSDVALRSTSRELIVRMLPGLIIGIVVAIGASVGLVRLTARPLVETAAAARRMAAGERRVPVPDSSVAEVHDVAAALTALDTALAESEGRQREFLLSISHELRTPLTALRGYAEGLADGVIPPDDAQRVGGILAAETDRLTAFVTDLLELARLEADDFSITPGPVDVDDVLATAADAWRGRAEQLDVAVTVSSSGVVARTDVRRLRQLLDGLIENALRVSPPGSTLRLSARTSPDVVEIDVTDEGPGLSDDDLARAFDRGALRERYRDSRPVGTGLGLSIAHRLASRLGGTLTASRPVAADRTTTGTTFRLTLPAPAPAPAPAPRAPAP